MLLKDDFPWKLEHIQLVCTFRIFNITLELFLEGDFYPSNSSSWHLGQESILPVGVSPHCLRHLHEDRPLNYARSRFSLEEDFRLDLLLKNLQNMLQLLWGPLRHTNIPSINIKHPSWSFCSIFIIWTLTEKPEYLCLSCLFIKKKPHTHLGGYNVDWTVIKVCKVKSRSATGSSSPPPPTSIITSIS